MSDRRIPAHNGHNTLKQVAGLIEKLSYLDMTKLERMLDQHGMHPTGGKSIPEILLKVSECILAEPEEGRR